MMLGARHLRGWRLVRRSIGEVGGAQEAFEVEPAGVGGVGGVAHELFLKSAE